MGYILPILEGMMTDNISSIPTTYPLDCTNLPRMYDEVEQFFLAVEMVVEAAFENADFVGDVADGGGMIALGPKHLRRCRNDVVERSHQPVRWPTSAANAS